MKTKPEITNIAVELSYLGSKTFPLSCDYDGARYHLWIEAATMQPEHDILYKNPPRGAAGQDN